MVALRSRALRRLSGKGAMASLAMSTEEATPLLGQDVVIAAINGPASTVISGPPDQIQAIVDGHERARRINVDCATHWPQVDEITGEVRELLTGITPLATDIAFYSTVTGTRIDTTTLNIDYWIANLRRPVRFMDAVTTLLGDGYRAFIESSPHPVLTHGMQDTFDHADVTARAIPTLRRDEGDLRQVLRAAGQAYAAGVPVDWSGYFPGTRTVDLPTYAFQRERYWLEASGGFDGDPADLGLVAAGHPLLGAVVDAADGGVCLLTGRISQQSHSWPADHAVLDTVLLPGTAFVELALYAAARTGGGDLAELTLETPLVLPERGAVDLQVAVAPPDDAGRRSLTVHSRTTGGAWTRHATGVLAADVSSGAPPDLTGTWPPPGATAIPVEELYPGLDARGYRYGPSFRGLTGAWRLGDDVYADIVRAQAAAQPFAYPSGLVEVPMSPVSDVTAFRAHYWKLDWFLKAVRLAVQEAIKTGGVFDFLAHPSCLVVEDPSFEVVKLICDLVKDAGDTAAVVGLGAIAARGREVVMKE